MSEVLPEIHDWRIVTFLPGSDPFRALAEQLAAAVPAPDRIGVVDDLAKRFEDREDGLRTAIGALFADNPKTALIVVDQFEEILTHLSGTPDSAGRSSARAERLIANLVDAAENSDGRIRVLITLRADFVPQCLEYPQLRSLLEGNQLLLGELGPEALREAVKFPARKVGAFFENGLVEVILRDVQQQRGSLPLLQHALKELWQARRGPWFTLEAYEKSGGVAGALRRRAQYTYEEKLKDDQQRAIARSIFVRLTSLGEGVSDSRRRVPREELFPYGIGRRVVEEVLAVLSHKDARLIVVNNDDTIEVTHEALIHTWDTLRGWIDANREQLRRHRRLSESAKEWEESGKNRAYLYRGGRLERVEQWTNSPVVPLNAAELAFLEASIAERREMQRQQQQRQRLLVVAVLVFALLAVAACAAAIFGFWQKGEAEKQAREALARTLAAQSEFEADRNPDVSFLLAIEAAKRAFSVETDHALRRALALQPRPIKKLSSSAPGAAAIAFSPNGQLVATAGSEGSVGIYEVTSGRKMESLMIEKPPVAIEFSADGKTLSTLSSGKVARTLDLQTKALTDPVVFDETEYPLGLSEHGRYVIAVDQWGTQPPNARVIRVLEMRDGHEVAHIGYRSSDGTMATGPAAFSGTLIAIAEVEINEKGGLIITSGNSKVALWDTGTGKRSGSLPYQGEVADLAFSPGGEYLLIGVRYRSAAGYVYTLHVWNAKSAREVATPLSEDSMDGISYPSGNKLLFSSDSKYFAVVLKDSAVRIFRSSDGHEVVRAAFQGGVTAIALDPDGKRFAVASRQSVTEIFEVDDGTEVTHMGVGHLTGGVNDIAWSPDSYQLATVGYFYADVWDIGLAREWRFVPSEGGTGEGGRKWRTESVAFSSDGKYLAVGDIGNSAYIWDVEARQMFRAIPHRGGVTSLAFSPTQSGYLAMAASSEYRATSPMPTSMATATPNAQLWDIYQRRVIKSISHQQTVNQVEFSRDGRYLATASDDKSAAILDVSTGNEIRIPCDGEVKAVAFNDDGRLLATAIGSKVIIWEIANKKRLTTILHPGKVSSVRFSPDGLYLATASEEGKAHVWEAATGRELVRIDHAGLRKVAFSPNGQYLATAGSDENVRVWLWQIKSLIGEACSRAQRHLDDSEWQQYIGFR